MGTLYFSLLHDSVARFCGVRLCLRGSMKPTKNGSVADSDLDNPKMDSETVLPNSVKRVLSEEEAWELFA